MNSRPQRALKKIGRSALVVGLLLAGGLLLYLLFTAKTRATAKRVHTLLQQVDENYLWQTNAAFDALQEMGAEAYPALREILAWRESTVHQLYERLWLKSPGGLRKFLPQPDSSRGLQVKASAIVPELGPVPSRALAGVTADYIMQDDHPYGTIYPLRTLYWSIPESPKSTLALSNWLARWETETHLFGMLYAYELWPKVPQLGPILAQWLRNPDGAAEAAASLGKMGTNAAFALPLLLEAAEKGVVGTNTTLKVQNPTIDTFTWNRINAAVALGSIGVTNPAVHAVLERAVTDKNPELAIAAVEALAALGYELDQPITTFLAEFRAARSHRTKDVLTTLGKLGLKARAALPWVTNLTNQEVAGALPEFQKGPRDHPNSSQEIQTAALIALCRIDPSQIPLSLPALTRELFAGQWEAAEALLEFTTHHDQIVAAVEPVLAHEHEIQRMFAAAVILKHQPAHRKARDELYSRLKADNPELRLTAAVYICRAGADLAPVIAVVREGLLMPGDLPQVALNSVEAMGEQARVFIPELKQCLNSKNSGARDWAGRILRRLAPEQMPPIE